MTDTNNSPASSSSDSTSVPFDQSPPTRTRSRSLLIGGGAVLAGLLFVGGGVAVGAAIADDRDDDRDSSAVGPQDGQNAPGEQSAQQEQSAQDGTSAVPPTDLGTDSAADLIQIVADASKLADGDAVAVEAERDGAWDVTFVSDAGDETEVRVPVAGAATVLSTEPADADDTRAAAVLDDATIDALVAAALADTDGRILDLEIDDDSGLTYDVVVLAADGRTVDLDVATDFTVTSSRIDD